MPFPRFSPCHQRVFLNPCPRYGINGLATQLDLTGALGQNHQWMERRLDLRPPVNIMFLFMYTFVTAGITEALPDYVAIETHGAVFWHFERHGG